MKTRLEKITLVGIVFLAVLLRIVLLSSNPPSLNWDEVSHGVNAYSILESGRDEWGESFPMIFRAYGDYKLPLYIYLTTPSIAIFGLNEFSIRLPSMIAGVITVIISYFLVLELFQLKKSKRNIKINYLAALAAVLVAVEPWSLFLSRAAFEANLAVMLIASGIYFFLKALKKPSFFIFSSISFGLSVWSYNSARVFIPILLVTFIILFRRVLLKGFKQNIRVGVISILLMLVFFLPMFYQLVKPSGQARYGKVAIIDDGAIGNIIKNRRESDLPHAVSRLLYNRPTYFTSRFLSNWVRHYSGNFLFFQGGDNYQFNVQDRGLLYLVNLPFLILGVIFLLKKRDRATFVLLSWFYLAPIASSLTREAPHVLRSSVILPTPMIISAYGLFIFLEKMTFRLKNRKRLFLLGVIIYLIILMLSLGCYLKANYGNYRREYSFSWQYGYKEVVEYSNEVYERYEKIIITKKYGEPHAYVLFYGNITPESFRNDPNLIRFYQSNWYWVDRFDKYHFVNDWDIPSEEWQPFVLESGLEVDCRNLKCLLITSEGNAPKKWERLKTVEFLNRDTAFEIYEN